ncbi:hypothetical protein [Streptomyces africanus]|uniref:hypothetical protein n=1 Tax=Streptomyces africanus TaxID=231024 RepID=UPI000A3A8C5F|nr:hypothetical protein [Streptomyces africanus]
MAAPLLSPYVAADETSLGDAVELLRLTGHSIDKTTLARQCRARGVRLVKHGRTLYASWSDLLVVHRDWVDAREARA